MVLLPAVITSFMAFFMPTMDVPATHPTAEVELRSEEEILFDSWHMEHHVQRTAFVAAMEQVQRSGVSSEILAIADMSLPSTERRLTVIDLKLGVVLLRTFVAHGQGTGELMAEHFSNMEGSHQTSLGLYRVGIGITSPKHGPALLLHGLEPGVNHRALEREIIMHSADYVSTSFIDEHGRLGRSWGCPAVPREDMDLLQHLLAGDGLLYIHA